MADEVTLKTLLANGGAEELGKLLSNSIYSSMTNVLDKRDAEAAEAAMVAREHEMMLEQHTKATKGAEKTPEDLMAELAASIGILNDGISSLSVNIDNVAKNNVLDVPNQTDGLDSRIINTEQSSKPSFSLSDSFAQNVKNASGISVTTPKEDKPPVTSIPSLTISTDTARASGKQQTVESDEAARDRLEQSSFRNSVIKPIYESLYDSIEDHAVNVRVVNMGGIGGGDAAENGSTISWKDKIAAALLGIIGGGVAGLASGVFSNIKGIWGPIAKNFRAVGEGVFGALKTVGSKVLSGLEHMKGIGPIVQKIESSIMESVTKIKQAVTTITDTIKTIGSKIGEAANKVKTAITELTTKASDAASNLAKTLKESPLGKFGKTVSETAGKLFNTAKGALSKTFSGITKSVSSLGGIAAKSAKAAFKVTKFAGGKLRYVQAATNLGSTFKNTYDMYKKGGNIKDVMTNLGGGTIDALMNVTMLSNVGGAIGALIDGKGLKGAAKGFIDPTDGGKKVTYGMGLMANIQNLVGNETEMTKRLAKASNYDMTLDQVGLRQTNKNIDGFTQATYGLSDTKNIASSSMKNTSAPTATTRTTETIAKASPNNGLNADELAIKLAETYKTVLLSPEVIQAQRDASKVAGEAITGTLMGD